MSNAFDDLPPLTAVVPTDTGMQAANAFDDLTPPLPKREPKAELPPVNAADRAHAAEGGILGGLAYGIAAIPDAVPNLYNLGKAGVGTAYHAASGKDIPAWLEAGDPSPIGHWLTSQMDKNELTSTQAPRPDDTVSRYLNTAGNVVGGVAAGGGPVSAMPRTVAAVAPGAAAGRYIEESAPFSNPSANRSASLLAQVLSAYGTGSMLRPKGDLLPENQIKNDAVTAGQKLGYEFPPATTNPTNFNTALETMAGKTNVGQHMAINNQKVTNEGARADIGLPPGKGGSITDLELATAKANAAPGYDALRNAGPITAPPNFAARLDSALSRQSGAGRLSTKLADSELGTIVDDLKSKPQFDASDAMDAISALRDKASGAYRTGNAQAGAAYKGVSKVLEDAIDQDLSSRGGAAADLIGDFRDSRQKFAIIHSLEEARNETTGNVNAQKLAAALKKGEYLSGNLEIAGRSAGQAPQAFAEPTKTAGSHLGVAGALLGGGALAEMMPESIKHMGATGVGLAAAYPASRWLARQYVQGPGQGNALPRTKPSIVTPAFLEGIYGPNAVDANR